MKFIQTLSALSLATCLFIPVMMEADPWSDTLLLPDSPLFSDPQPLDDLGLLNVSWAKFTLLTAFAMDNLYFQDSKSITYHYDFAAQYIPHFSGYTRNQFDQVTLFNSERLALLGAVLLISNSQGDPIAYGIQLVGQDAIAKENIANGLERVSEAIAGGDALPFYYIPSYEQARLAQDNLEWFHDRGIEVTSMRRWTGSRVSYSDGWALGRLVKVDPDDIDQAYLSGQLLPTDILLTTYVPAEVPFVAGIISTQPSTPNSHVATLAQSWDIPFVYAGDETEFLDSLIGKDTILVAGNSTGISIKEFDPEAPEGMRDEIVALKQAPELGVQPMEPAGVLYLPTDGLRPEDIPLVGGKAAHFGLLRAAIPDHSPEAIAFTFDLWNGFLDQHLPGRGRSLREEIQSRLEPFQTYPPDMGQLAGALDDIREIIEDETTFTADQTSEIFTALSAFDSGRKIRFRSSTNIEDTDTYTGAGLYESASGCLLDDLDSDESGPSHCDPSKDEERGVLRAIRKVFASFYTDNAYLERLRLGIDESVVGMALLVHHSFPDEDELANGVAVLRRATSVEFTTQLGAVSVTNPDGEATPESLTSYLWNSGSYSSSISQRSSLLRLGDEAVMELPDDYQALHSQMAAVQDLYDELYPDLSNVELEFEFKKMSPDDLVIKQVRPLPEATATTYPRYLMSGNVDVEPYEGEASNVFAIHRGQSRISGTLKSIRIDTAESLESPFESLAYTRPVEGEIITWDSSPATWPDAEFYLYEDGFPHTVLAQSWSETIAHREATRSLEILLPAQGASPFLFAESLTYRLRTDYPEQPNPWNTWPSFNTDPEPELTEYVILSKPTSTNQPGSNDLYQEREADTFGMKVDITFYWPPDPNAAAGYTAPLRAWELCRISGLTTDPIVLTDPWAMTYRPDHHNFGESFVFEPRLDPVVPPATLEELAARNIELIYVYVNNNSGTIGYAGPDSDLIIPSELWFGPYKYSSFIDYEYSEWFGYLNASQFPEVHHLNLGWIHAAGTGRENLWLWIYNTPWKWLWTNRTLFPYFYHLESDSWMYCLLPDNLGKPSWWYNYKTDEWTSAP